MRQKREIRPDPVYRVVDPSLPTVFITDMDGTMSFLGGRNPYHAGKCDLDPPNLPMVRLARRLMRPAGNPGMHLIPGQNPASELIVVSARFEAVRPQTEHWLIEQGVAWRHLFMRADGDTRKDALVKAEILRDCIWPFFNIEVAFDDRQRVVDMWRHFGIACFQVNPGDF